MEWDLYFIDALLLSLLVFVFYKGYKKGVINQVVWLLSFVLAYFAGAYFCYRLAGLLDFPIYNKNVSVAVSFAVIFLLVIIGMYYLGKYLTKIVNLSVVGLVNSILGGLFNSLIYLAIVLSISNLALFALPKADDYLEKTVSLNQIVKFEKWFMDQDYIDEIKDGIEDLRL